VQSARAWLVVSPVIAAGVLGAHTLAYRLTGATGAPFHSYLEHAPQVLLVLAVCGLAIGLCGARLSAPPAWVFPVAALASFVAQEQLERLVHGEWALSLLMTPVLLVGLALQVPVAVLAWALARWLLAAVGAAATERPVRASFAVVVSPMPSAANRSTGVRTPPGRAPPTLALSG
jgi:hypothetical protein